MSKTVGIAFLALDGEQVQGHSLKVTLAGRIDTTEMTGDSSSTSTSHGGWRPMRLNVSLVINRVNDNHLTHLINLWQRMGDDGTPHVYNITEDTCLAAGVRRVHFTDNLQVSEQDNPKVWRVEFSLLQYDSTAAQREERETTETLINNGVPRGILEENTAFNELAAAAEISSENFLGELDRLSKNALGWVLGEEE